MRATTFQNEPDALTVSELAQLLGKSRDFAQKQVRALVAAGKARATKKRVMDSGGRAQLKPAYVLTT